jgi:RNA polymerase sigma-70 factor (ECF subfamily)
MDPDMSDERHPPETPASLASSILDGIKRQDARAWERLERLFRPVVKDWCRRKGLAESDTDDICQQVFLAVHESVGEFRREKPGDSFRGWIWTITQRKIADFFRDQNDQAAGGTENQLFIDQLPEAVPSTLSADLGLEADRTAQLLLQAVLSELENEFESSSWTAFRGMVVDGHSAEELAGQLRMTAKAVRQAKYRILHRLRQEMAELA